MKKKWSKILLGSRTLLGSNIKRSEITGLFFVTVYWKSLNRKMEMKAVKQCVFLLLSLFGNIVESSIDLLLHRLFPAHKFPQQEIRAEPYLMKMLF